MHPVKWMRRRGSRPYWALQHAIRRVVGGAIEERYWRNRVVSDVGYFEHPHRGWLTDRIVAHQPESILEVGCGWGPNFVHLARRLPRTSLFGIDISPLALEAAKAQLPALGCPGVELVEGRAHDLSAFADDSVDLVFTDAVLFAVPPAKAALAVREMLRVARKAVLLLELHRDSSRRDVYADRVWVRDYRRLLTPLPAEVIRLTKLSAPVWPTPVWERYGHLIEVTLRA